jgi:hypothetical protein
VNSKWREVEVRVRSGKWETALGRTEGRAVRKAVALKQKLLTAPKFPRHSVIP